MRKIKRVVSMVLAAVMCLCMIPTFAQAADAPVINGTITVTTTDAVTNEPISGASYKLERLTAGLYQDVTTAASGADGKVAFTGALVNRAGWYRVMQTSVPSGYEVNNAPHIVYLDETTTSSSIAVKNTQERALYIYRVDPASGNPVGGARYEVKDNNDNTVATGTTRSDGFLIIPHLAPGEYTVTELYPLAGYENYPNNVQKVTITGLGVEPYQVVFYGDAKDSIVVVNLDGATGEPIVGSTFSLTTSSEAFVASNTTNTAGIVVFNNLENGVYQVRQTSVGAGYVKDLKNAVATIENTNIYVTITNLKPATIQVFSVDSTNDSALPGMKFSLYNQSNNLVKGPVTADANGRVAFDGLVDGNYTVVCDPPAGYVADTQYQSVTITKGKSLDLVFTATSKGSMQLISLDFVSGQRLPDTRFRVSKMNGALVGEYVTGSDGTALLQNLDDGYYIIEQIGVPAGYVLVNASQTARVSKGSVTPVNFTQRAKPFILVETTVKNSRMPVAGAFFELRSAAGVRIATGTTNADGTYVFDNVEPGTYTVNFSYAPDGYTIDTEKVTVNVSRQQAGFAKFTVSKHSAIIITKLDDKDRTPLEGAMLQLRSAEGKALGTYTTDATGTAVTDVLTPGKYYVQELYAPDGYVPTSTSRLVTVSNNETAQVVITNAKKTAIVIYAYDKQGNPLADVNYSVSSAVTGRELAKVKTNSSGVAVYETADPGQYVVQEISVPGGYTLATPVQSRVIVNTNAATAVNFVHTPKSVILMQTADVASGDAVPGAVYRITTASGEFVGDYETDDNGEAVTDVLAAGTYYVKQTVAPSGYLLNTTTQTIRVDKDKVNPAKFFVSKMTGIVIEAVSQHDHNPLADCTFEIYDEAGKQIFHGTTDASGILNTGALTPGKYTIKQLGKPDNYSIVQDIRTVSVTTNEPVVVVFENVALTALYIELIDEESRLPLANGHFKIEQIGGDYVAELVTDNSGSAVARDIPTGTYMVHESAAPDGYVLVGTYQWAKVVSSADTHLKFTNQKVSGLVIKALTLNEHSPLANAVFELYTNDTGKLAGTYTTDSTGTILVADLQPGSYLIKEVKAPDGFTLQTATQSVKVTTYEATTATFYHTTHSSLTINKKDVNGKPIAGAVYRITTADGEFVGDYTTSIAGQVIVPYLAPGEYRVYETSVPSGYILDPTPRKVIIRDDQPAVLDFINDMVSGLTIINTGAQSGAPIRGNRFKITKIDGTLIGNYVTDAMGRINVELQPGDYVVYQTYVVDGYEQDVNTYNVTVKANVRTTLEVQNDQLSAIRIRFVDQDDGTGIYNVKVEILDSRNNYIGTYSSDDSGYINLDKVLNAGSYKVRIVTVPSGYDKDTTTRTVTVKVGETTLITWKLSGTKGQIRIITLSETDSAAMNIRKSSRLSGAEYEILDARGKHVRTVLGMNNGEAFSGALPVGTYYIQQTGAPAGFLPNSARVTVNITKENKDVTITVYNAAGSYNLTVTAGGQAIGYAGMQTKFYFSGIRASSNIAMSNFYLHVRIPTDALRAGTLYTGTWNFSAAYSIQYRTNLNDYRTLAYGLNSKSQYSYDLSTNGLALGVNEYVTDIRFVFANVPAGFHESIAPSLYCTVLPTVPSGYQYTVRCDIGGQIGGTFYTGAGEFSALVINTIPVYPLPGTLPKTGY